MINRGLSQKAFWFPRSRRIENDSYICLCTVHASVLSLLWNRNYDKCHFVSILDLDPCRNATCKYHSPCVSIAPHQFACRCKDNCPSYEEQVCASNGRTYTNLCLLKREICQTRGNFTHYHPGSCTGIFFNVHVGVLWFLSFVCHISIFLNFVMLFQSKPYVVHWTASGVHWRHSACRKAP